MDVFSVEATNFELTDSIKEVAIEKMNKVLSHDKNIDRLEVVLKHEKTTPERFAVKCNLSFHGKHYHVEYEASDLYYAIGEAATVLLRDIRREHRKYISQRKN